MTGNEALFMSAQQSFTQLYRVWNKRSFSRVDDKAIKKVLKWRFKTRFYPNVTGPEVFFPFLRFGQNMSFPRSQARQAHRSGRQMLHVHCKILHWWRTATSLPITSEPSPCRQGVHIPLKLHGYVLLPRRRPRFPGGDLSSCQWLPWPKICGNRGGR